jgi:membrane protein YdbS with pleckstrin-like domain
MYTLVKDLALRIMKAPTEPPETPAGSHDDVQVYRASPKFLTYRLLGFWLIFSANWLILWAVILAGVVTRETPLVVIGLVLMAVLAVVQFCIYFSIRIDYDMRYYITTDRSMRVRQGAFIVKEQTITYANIQNLRIVQGPLLRLFGIWHLRVDTAGGGAVQHAQPGSNAHRVQMAGIENAREVRDTIQEHIRRRGVSAGLGDPDDRDDDAPRPVVAAGADVRDALKELKQATAALRTSADARERRP